MIKNIFDDVIWNIKAFIAQPIIPTVSMQYVLDNDGTYSSNDFMSDKYVYYWIGDFKTGKQVKVKSLDVARYEITKRRINDYDIT
jgi:hypothetical protein